MEEEELSVRSSTMESLNWQSALRLHLISLVAPPYICPTVFLIFSWSLLLSSESGGDCWSWSQYKYFPMFLSRLSPVNQRPDPETILMSEITEPLQNCLYEVLARKGLLIWYDKNKKRDKIHKANIHWSLVKITILGGEGWRKVSIEVDILRPGFWGVGVLKEI